MRTHFLFVVAAIAFPMSSNSFAATSCEPSGLQGREVVAAISEPRSSAFGRDQNVGRSAAACGHNFSAVNLLERANAERPTVLARFNLATLYERTGRIAEARTLYLSAAADGETTFAILDTDPRAPQARQYRINLANEAIRRVNALRSPDFVDGTSVATSALPSSAAAASALGVDTAATADGPLGPTRSGAEALTLDGLR